MGTSTVLPSRIEDSRKTALHVPDRDHRLVRARLESMPLAREGCWPGTAPLQWEPEEKTGREGRFFHGQVGVLTPTVFLFNAARRRTAHPPSTLAARRWRRPARSWW